MDQAQHRAEDADRRRVAAGRFPDLGALLELGFPGVDLDFKDFPQPLGLDAIHQQLQALLDERVFHLGDPALEGQQPLLAGHVAPAHHLGDQRVVVEVGRCEHPAEHLHPSAKHFHRTLQHHRPEGAADDDQERGRLDQGPDMPSLEHLPHQDCRKAEGDADETDAVH